MVIFKWKT